jgi:protein TonB
MTSLLQSRPLPETWRDFAPLPGVARPALVAWCLSAAGHAAVLVWFGAATPTAPRLAAFEPIDVMLAAARPAVVRPEPLPRPQPVAAVMPDTRSAIAADDDRRDGGDDRHDSPRVEARHDVAALNNPKPPYPLAARRHGLEGRVLLTAHVRADGRCAEVRLRASSGHELLDHAALETVRRWRFLPARRGDTAIDSWVEIPISFRLAG